MRLMSAITKPASASTYWGSFIVEILKKLLEFNQLRYGSKKSF
jgi:hypothetical protein